MRLTAIRLSGFKSFADNTIFPVDAAVTGIIGPNGCGKSNIIDAVRWVLGESSAKHLRGQNISDVIFGGSKNRKAVGQATVELNFDNADGTANGEFGQYAEIVVQRKVTSDGQSQYSINKQKCRRKDVVELLQGTGIGARSYAVIEQGMVSRIVESKPEELRVFIEESAGIGLYKTRRRESELKMQEAKELLGRNLERLNELEKSRNRLAQEAETARIYREFQSEYEALSQRLLSWQIWNLRERMEKSTADFQAEEEALADAIVNLQKAETARDEADKALQESELELNQAEISLHEAEKIARESENALIRRRDRAAHSEVIIKTTQERIERYQSQIQEDERQILLWQEEVEAKSEELAVVEEENFILEEELSAAEQAFHEKNTELQAQEQSRAEREKRRARAEKIFAENQNRCTAIEERIASLGAEITELTEKIEEESLACEELNLNAENLAVTLAECEETAEQSRENLALLEEQAKTASINFQEADREITVLSTRLHAITDFLPKIKDESAENQNIATAPKNALPLYQLLNVAPDWQEALEKFLVPHFNICAVEAEFDATENKLPFARFLLNKNERENAAPEHWQQIVQTRADISSLLGNLQPLNKKDGAISPQEFAAIIQGKELFLTKDGSILGQGAYLRAESGGENLGLAAKQAEKAEIEEKIITAEEKIKNIEAEKNQAEELLKQAKIENKNIEEKLKNIRKNEQEAQQKAKIAAEKISASRKILGKEQENLSNLQQDLVINQEQLKNAEIELNSAEEEIENVASLEKLTANVAELKNKLQKKKEEKQSVNQKYQQLKDEIQTLTSNISGQNTAQSRLMTEIQNHNKQIKELQDELNDLQDEIGANQASHHDNLAVLAELQNVFDAKKQATSNAKNIQKQLSEAYLQAENKRNLAEAELNHRQETGENLAKQLAAKEEELAEQNRSLIKFQEGEKVDETAVNKRLKELKQAMEKLGAVNFAAIESFNEIDREFAELSVHCNDLEQTLKLLQEAVAELDEETKKRLNETFNAVAKNFSEFFPILFRGGEGKLEWTEQDILQAGLKISVRPPGKKVKNLSVLSGGEKALTAVALVFSFFKLNPAPFCLLDEIDAPLDDANVGRLCDLLREMAKKTQFIMITHHKKSMQSCDRLIGVTMSEPGVSRLVSVKFE
ncbi:MAG: chromosome segregation protein SMC [Cardiobacteriaceae bacterium]|nr:chromosome segregation protein SMC [Cardiobacteriaceae bacterium]